MKKIIIPLVLLFTFFFAEAQDEQIKTEINKLEQEGIQAILQKDSATLRKLWSPTFMVNAPNNKVVRGGQVAMVMDGRISYTSYIGEMEQLLVNGDIVITMGHETVVPVIGNPKGGQTIERRYTHVWERKNGSWLLMARHASETCSQ
ncbi:MAG: nuclear transport factor 2 family protein [Ferruginibacter sp.]|nr:nuclear transport factor 2 family protein [Ferruginibacter sp.]